MAIVTSLYYGYLNTSEPDLSFLASGRVKMLNDHKIKVRDEWDLAWMKGDFHANSHGEVTRGTISSIEFNYGNCTFKQIQIGFRELFAAVESKSLADDASLFAKIFRGDDQISGSINQDHLNGWGGNDILYAGDSGDILTGGPGADVFDIAWVPNYGWGQSQITDFSQAEGDKINLVHFGSFQFADLKIYEIGGETIVEAPTGTPEIPLKIHVHGFVDLTEGDFIL